MPYPGNLNDKIQRQNIWLSLGQDFALTIQPKDECGNLLDSFGFPDGTTVTMMIGTGEDALSWDATVTAAAISWLVGSGVPDGVDANTPLLCRVVQPYGEGTISLNWFIGVVKRDDPAT